MQIYVIDVGSHKNLGWATGKLDREDFDDCGTKLDSCISHLVESLQSGPAALGFEAPMFTPLRNDATKLLKARDGECSNGKSRPFSAGAGTASLVAGIQVALYALSNLRKASEQQIAPTFGHKPLSKQRGSLLLFEAFISGQNNKNCKDRHVKDARDAVKAFRNVVHKNLESMVSEPSCFNLLGAALLRVGWSGDFLHQECLVVGSSHLTY